MINNPELMQASAQLAKYVTLQSTSIIRDKIKVSKSNKNDKEQINILNEIIQELILEKNELIQIAQVYDEQIVAQKISQSEIDYITSNFIPLIEQFLNVSSENGMSDEDQKNLDIFKPLLSEETFSILQLLGFNYKRAIGEPLTELINSLIISQKPTPKEKQLELQKVLYERDIEYFKIFNDKEVYQRYFEFHNQEG